MVPLLTLPDEVLVNIISLLRGVEIECLARTFNERITRICLPLIRDRVAARRNKRHMLSLFDVRLPSVDAESLLSEAQFTLYGLELLYGPYSVPPMTIAAPFLNLDYLELNGDLYWLTALDKETTEEMSQYHDSGWGATEEQMNELAGKAKELGLTLPECFVRFMTDKQLPYLVPSAVAAFPTLGELTKMPLPAKGNFKGMCSYRSFPDAEIQQAPKKDGEDRPGQGYAVTFYEDQQGCYYWCLYLDTNGGHCVVGTDSSKPTKEDEPDYFDALFDRLTPLERGLNIVPLDPEECCDCVMEGTSFEEWLVAMYYVQWAWFVLEESSKDPPPPVKWDGKLEPLKEYIVRVYTEKGRASN